MVYLYRYAGNYRGNSGFYIFYFFNLLLFFKLMTLWSGPYTIYIHLIVTAYSIEHL